MLPLPHPQHALLAIDTVHVPLRLLSQLRVYLCHDIFVICPPLGGLLHVEVTALLTLGPQLPAEYPAPTRPIVRICWINVGEEPGTQYVLSNK